MSYPYIDVAAKGLFHDLRELREGGKRKMRCGNLRMRKEVTSTER